MFHLLIRLSSALTEAVSLGAGKTPHLWQGKHLQGKGSFEAAALISKMLPTVPNRSSNPSPSTFARLWVLPFGAGRGHYE